MAFVSKGRGGAALLAHAAPAGLGVPQPALAASIPTHGVVMMILGCNDAGSDEVRKSRRISNY